MANDLTNLPMPLTSFVGRGLELGKIGQRVLSGTRLLTLTGVGGVGKTRLALQVATQLQNTFADGVCFVSLAPLRQAAQVAPTILRAVGLQEVGATDPREHLLTHLRQKHLLLVLDNFESVVSAAPLIADLLETCPQLTLLVTSREVLHLRAEHQFPVPPLTLPDVRDLPDLEALAHIPAIDLFLQRAQAVLPDFHLTQENARALAQIAVRLDGLPLAIELASARIPLLSPEALLTRLGLEVLKSPLRDIPERHQTMRQAIAWSYALLDPVEQRWFRQLSVFAGGWTLEAAAAVCRGAGEDAREVLDVMASLREKSLIQESQ